MRTLLVLLVLVTQAFATTYNSDGSRADVQAKIDGASDGDTVTIPAGSFTGYTVALSISGKGIKLQGAGSGRIVADSRSDVTVGTGAKTFVIEASQSPSKVAALETLKAVSLVPNATIRLFQKAAHGTWMEGTVTSYAAPTLVMNITSTAGSGTHAQWLAATPAATTIAVDTPPANLINITEDTSHNVEISGIRFIPGTDTTNNGETVIGIYGNNGKPVLIHDCYFEMTGNSPFQVHSNVNRGVVWNCSSECSVFGGGSQCLTVKNEANGDAWAEASYFGANDTGGTHNFYVEDSDFHTQNHCADFASNARAVMRHCLIDNSEIGSHGADSDRIGLRYVEVYDNEFVFDGRGGVEFNLQGWVYLRGGTAVVTDNLMPDVSSMAYGNKNEVRMAVLTLQLNTPWTHSCWGANQVGIQYPAPRQVGFGRVTGAAATTETLTIPDGITCYQGDSEPVYIWNNDSGSGIWNPGTSREDNGGVGCTNPDSAVDYLIDGRDFFNDGTAKPGYVKYTYPHPLRTAAPATPGTTSVSGSGHTTSSGSGTTTIAQ